MNGRSAAPQNNRAAATNREEEKAIDDTRVAEAKLPTIAACTPDHSDEVVAKQLAH